MPLCRLDENVIQSSFVAASPVIMQSNHRQIYFYVFFQTSRGVYCIMFIVWRYGDKQGEHQDRWPRTWVESLNSYIPRSAVTWLCDLSLAIFRRSKHLGEPLFPYL